MEFKLLNGNTMPMVGFGTYTIRGSDFTRKVLDHSLSAGYRLFDTAAMYGNEDDIGDILKELLPKHNLSRNDIFITTKLYPSDHGDKAYKAIEESLRKLRCEYIDLYLIHWPGVYGVGTNSKENSVLRDKSWQQMVKAVENGLVKNIGVSNYTVRHLKELLENDHGIKPVVNQVEWHPYCYQPELLDFCKSQGILLQAYMSLGGTGNKDLLNNPKIKEIAKKLGKTSAQILLQWSIQQGVAVIPKSKSKEHIQSNINLNFTIPEEEWKILNSFKTKEKFDWDPEGVA